MAIRPRILLVGDEVTLLQSREMVLGTHFDVNSSARLSEAFGLVLKQVFDLIVVFPEIESWSEFAEFISRKRPKPTMVAVTRNGGDSPNWADAAVALGSAPFELLKVCAEKLGITLKSKSHGFSNRHRKKVVSISPRDNGS